MATLFSLFSWESTDQTECSFTVYCCVCSAAKFLRQPFGRFIPLSTRPRFTEISDLWLKFRSPKMLWVRATKYEKRRKMFVFSIHLIFSRICECLFVICISVLREQCDERIHKLLFYKLTPVMFFFVNKKSESTRQRPVKNWSQEVGTQCLIWHREQSVAAAPWRNSVTRLLGRAFTVVTGGLIKCSWCFFLFFSPRVLRVPSTDRPETLPHGRNLA